MRIILQIALGYFFQIINYAILIFCIGSWFVRPGTGLYDFWRKLGYFLEPLFRPAKFLLSRLRFMRSIPVDFSPWLTVILLGFVYNAVMVLLRWI